MSVLPAETHAELRQLLQALQSSDNTIRSQAEGHLQNTWTNTRPEILLMGLAEQIAASPETSVSRLFDCLLLTFERPTNITIYLYSCAPLLPSYFVE